jgi:hypothetical protein
MKAASESAACATLNVVRQTSRDCPAERGSVAMRGLVLIVSTARTPRGANVDPASSTRSRLLLNPVTIAGTRTSSTRWCAARAASAPLSQEITPNGRAALWALEPRTPMVSSKSRRARSTASASLSP